MPVAGLDLVAEIQALKRERNAVILAHNYQVKEIQELADFVGDSLGLAYKAAETKADVIAFCGVHFMAETAKIVNPTKTVVLPDLNAGCSLSDSCPAEKLEAHLRANADKNYYWKGNCYVHVEFTRQSIDRIKAEWPDAPVVAHPECTRAVRLLADEVCSTEKMISFCKQHPSQAFVIVTESGMLHRLRREVPGKHFIAGPTDKCACADCRYMKLNTLEKLHACLLNREPQIIIPEPVRARAELPLRRMLEWSR